MPSSVMRRRLLSSISYANRVTSLVGSSYLLRLWMSDEASGTTIFDYSPNKANKASAYTGVTLGQAGPISGHTAASFDGSTSFANVWDAALAAAFSGAEGTVSVWCKIAAGVWVDGTARVLVRLSAGGASNQIVIARSTTNNTLRLYRVANSNSLEVNPTTSLTDWIHLAITYSKSGDFVRGYLNGAQFGTDKTGLDTFAGSLTNTTTNIGANATTPTQVFSGTIGPIMVATRALSGSEIASLFFYR